MKFAFLIMGNYNPLTDHAEIGVYSQLLMGRF